MKEVFLRAVNSLLGAVEFLKLRVPEDIRVLPTAYGSDVTSYDEKSYLVTYGESYHVLVGKDFALDMKVVIRPGLKSMSPGITVEEKGYTYVGGHVAHIFRGKKGLLNKKDALVVIYYCDSTNRTIKLEFKGKPKYDLMDIFDRLEVICH